MYYWNTCTAVTNLRFLSSIVVLFPSNCLAEIASFIWRRLILGLLWIHDVLVTITGSYRRPTVVSIVVGGELNNSCISVLYLLWRK